MTTKKGFTLVELSVVIIIIGLILAGISTGSELIKEAGLRRLVDNSNSLIANIKLFKTKYGGLPGDLDNASSYFGCVNATTPAGCNGNGDHQIPFASLYEIQTVGHHLYLAEIILQEYPLADGRDSYIKSGFQEAVLSVRIPATIFGKTIEGLLIGEYNPADDREGLAPLTVFEASAIDLKTDDGVANTGRVFGFDPDCSTSAITAGGADYNYSGANANNKVCRLTIDVHDF